eukprot:m.206420 g.206420  ORF g.206420 m.206420 type:complete len:647 (-) comp18500_c1_seq5:16-1956(-)
MAGGAAVLVLTACLVAVAAAASGKDGKALPNIVYFLVDDLGYANVGFHNDEPLTPVIDNLAHTGLQLDRFYTYKFCSPTRSSLMSGRLPLHVNQQNHPPEEPGGGVPLNMTIFPDKLKKLGYQSHQIGKWHCGMSSTDRLPVQRGFESSFGYLSGAEDHFKQTRDGKVDFWRSELPAYHENGTYGTFQYTREALRIIRSHPADTPLFLYMAYQNVHSPLQVPTNFTDLYPKVKYPPRQKCLGMISAVDESIGTIVAALKDAELWDNTLVIFSSDNGGPHDHANNYPFRGSKGSDFEGGVRVAAYINGGLLPDHRRGQHVDAMMHVADWYATFGHLAGFEVEDDRAKAAALPQPDSLNMWDLLMGTNSTSPRTELPLSGNASGTGLIMTIDGHDYKLVRGKQGTSFFPGVHQPNSTDDGSKSNVDCGTGWLFDLTVDPVEHNNLAKSAAHATILKTMQARAAEFDASVFQSAGYAKADPMATVAANARYHGFWGPWQPAGQPPLPPSPAPPPPLPPNAFRLKYKTKTGGCLKATSLTRHAVVEVGACVAGSSWVNTTADYGGLINVDVHDRSAAFLRESTEHNCSLGDPAIVGVSGGSGGIVTNFYANTNQLILAACDNKCLVVGADDKTVTLGACDSKSSKVWVKA